MTFEEESINGVHLLTVRGRLDGGTAPVLEKQVTKLTDGSLRHLVVDLTAVDYVSSAGLRVLLIGAKRMKAAKGRLGLCGLQPNVKEVFVISGFTALFDMHADRKAALGR